MYNEITADELQQRLESGESINLIDVREWDEWEDGHIAQARLIPLSEFNARQDEVHEVEGQVVFICRSGARSGRVCEYMTRQGFEVINISDGNLGWHGPVVTGK